MKKGLQWFLGGCRALHIICNSNLCIATYLHYYQLHIHAVDDRRRVLVPA